MLVVYDKHCCDAKIVTGICIMFYGLVAVLNARNMHSYSFSVLCIDGNRM